MCTTELWVRLFVQSDDGPTLPKLLPSFPFWTTSQRCYETRSSNSPYVQSVGSSGERRSHTDPGTYSCSIQSLACLFNNWSRLAQSHWHPVFRPTSGWEFYHLTRFFSLSEPSYKSVRFETLAYLFHFATLFRHLSEVLFGHMSSPRDAS